MADDETTAPEPESPSDGSYVGSCLTAAVLTFVAPFLLFGLMVSGAGFDFVGLLCPLIIMLPIVGLIWGIVLAITGASRAASNRNTRTASSDGDGEMPATDDEGRML